MSVTLSELLTEIKEVLQDTSYTDTNLTSKINAALNAIAGGIRMPNGLIAPPLPDLFTIGTVTASTSLPYVSLPADYCRKVTVVADSSGNRISGPSGGDYYAFELFIKQASDLRLAESGSIYRAAVKGTKLYYQGIPTSEDTIYLHYFKTPTTLASDTDIPSCLPAHLQSSLLVHYVLGEIFGAAIEDGQDNRGRGSEYHNNEFYKAMTDLIDYVGIDASPQYYGDDGFRDYGVCD